MGYTGMMDFTSFKKLEHVEVRPREVDADRLVTAIVKVKRANYHPGALEVRKQIDDCLFTAQFKAGALPDLEADPLVETISLASTLASY